MSSSVALQLEPLTRAAFAPFGDVIEMSSDRAWYHINSGTTKRYHRLAEVDVIDAAPIISMCRTDAFHMPMRVTMLERHPHGTQAFIPTTNTPFIVVVAPTMNGENNPPDEHAIRAFFAQGNQGVSYNRGTWHHPLMTYESAGSFVIVDRDRPDDNCDVIELTTNYVIEKSTD